jgi:formylglycine-generating enzyme required for sulfatase activity
MGNDGFDAPVHNVTLAGYWIYQTKITNRMFAQCVALGSCTPPAQELGGPVYSNPEYANHPVVGVTWDQAQAYCTWTQGRLPTEAEWEKAARGEYGNEWPWGNEFDKNKCNSYEGGKGGTTPVGAYSPQGDSPYGVSDMVGNVWEWCATKWQNSYQSYVDDNDLSGDALRVVRGGSFDDDQRGARVAVRGRNSPGYRDGDQGFRVVVAPRLS